MGVHAGPRDTETAARRIVSEACSQVIAVGWMGAIPSVHHLVPHQNLLQQALQEVGRAIAVLTDLEVNYVTMAADSKLPEYVTSITSPQLISVPGRGCADKCLLKGSAGVSSC